LGGKLKGFDVALFGDNHKQFQARSDDCQVLNPGCLIPRKIDEQENAPCAGLLLDDGTIQIHHFDVTDDVWIEKEEEICPEAENVELDEFLRGLEKLETGFPDYREAVLKYIQDHDVGEGVKKEMLSILGE